MAEGPAAGAARGTPGRQNAAAHTGADRTSTPALQGLGELPFDLGCYRGVPHTSSPSDPPLSCTGKALSLAIINLSLFQTLWPQVFLCHSFVTTNKTDIAQLFVGFLL